MKKFVTMLLCIGILAGNLSACKSNEKPTDTTSSDTESLTTIQTSTETEPPFVLETEEDAEPEEKVYPYDNAHAYIFAYSDKRTQWTTNDLDASAEFHLLRLRPTGGDPIVSEEKE